MQRTYISIDLKSFYASVECRERGLDPLDTNLVVADERRTDKTICLAVTPSLKSYGIPGRGRLFEVKQRVQQINAARRFAAPGRQLCGSSCSYAQLQAEPQLALDLLLRRRGWPIIWNTAREFTKFICVMWRRGYHRLFCGRGVYGCNAIF